jgi:hypothetical protein
MFFLSLIKPQIPGKKISWVFFHSPDLLILGLSQLPHQLQKTEKTQFQGANSGV